MLRVSCHAAALGVDLVTSFRLGRKRRKGMRNEQDSGPGYCVVVGAGGVSPLERSAPVLSDARAATSMHLAIFSCMLYPFAYPIFRSRPAHKRNRVADCMSAHRCGKCHLNRQSARGPHEFVESAYGWAFHFDLPFFVGRCLRKGQLNRHTRYRPATV